MNTLAYVHDLVLPAALKMLPAKMDTPAARALVLSIGLQESGLEKRRQMGGGPARGFFEFEHGTPQTRGGITGVLLHPASKPHIEEILRTMAYDLSVDASYAAVEHNDILAAVFARLLLWTSPLPLPKRDDAHGAWNFYLSCWRPGTPRPATWNAFYERAWEVVEP